MSFYPGLTKSAQEVIFCRMLQTVPYLSVTFNLNLIILFTFYLYQYLSRLTYASINVQYQVP